MDLKDFNDLADVGRVKRTITVGSHEIVMHTLNSNEYGALAARIGDEGGVTKRLELLQREVLVHSIETVDGKQLTVDDKASLVGMMQIGLSNMLYEEYGKMVEEQNKLLEDSKKNSA